MTDQGRTGLMMDFDGLYRGQGVRVGNGETFAVIPWRLDGPQPIVTELADTGQIVGPVLECGCGLGDNALFLAGRGYEVTAVDAAAAVIDQDRVKAAACGAAVDFRVADATVLEGIGGGFNTILDCAMLHCLTDEQRRVYLAAAHRVSQPGARLHILCFPDTVTGNFPMPGHTDEASLRRDLSERWRIERMEIRHYTTGMSRQEWREQIAARFDRDADPADGVDDQGRVLMPIWQITATRV